MIEFIADVADNHNGERGRCRQLIRAAARVGCTGIKFSLARVERIFAPQILRASPALCQRRRSELPRFLIPELSAYAREQGLRFGLQMFDLETVDEFQAQADFLAIGPREMPWLDLVDRCADTGLPLLVDTGLGEASEVWNAVQTALEAGCVDLTMLRSTGLDPAPEESCNLAGIGTLRELLVREFAPLYDDVALKAGWSDHSVSPGVIARALNHWGCDLVEFRLDLDGAGSGASRGINWLPDRLAGVIAGGYMPVRKDCDGTGRIAPSSAEMEARDWRADPDDGWRPRTGLRKSWLEAQPAARRRGPDVYFVVGGAGSSRLSRCVALAERLRDDHDADILFFIRGEQHQSVFLTRHGFNWTEFSQTQDAVEQITFLNNLSANNSPPVCVIDRPQDQEQLVSALKERRALTVVIDPADYLVRGDVTYLRERVPTSHDESSFLNLVVSFSGAAPQDPTVGVVSAVHQVLPRATVRVQLSPSRRQTEITAQILAGRFPAYDILGTGDSPDALIAAADLVITDFGQTMVDALCLGVPVLLLDERKLANTSAAALLVSGAMTDLSGNDTATDEGLVAALGELFGDQERLSQLRFHAREVASEMIDGQGAARIAARVLADLAGTES